MPKRELSTIVGTPYPSAECLPHRHLITRFTMRITVVGVAVRNLHLRWSKPTLAGTFLVPTVPTGGPLLIRYPLRPFATRILPTIKHIKEPFLCFRGRLMPPSIETKRFTSSASDFLLLDILSFMTSLTDPLVFLLG